MELCEGGSLSDEFRRAKESGKIRLERVWTVFMQVTSGLHYLHQQRLLHRDLKPANCLLTSAGDVKIGDFGLAMAMQSRVMIRTYRAGTLLYWSPEVISKRPYNEKADIWALGCILYECMTLRHPFSRANTVDQVMEKISSADYQLLDDSGKVLPQVLVQTCHACLQITPSSRPSTNFILANKIIQYRASGLGIWLDDSK